MTRPGTGIALTRPSTQDQLRPFTPSSPWFTVPTTPNNPAETGIMFIDKVSDILLRTCAEERALS